MSGKIGVNKLKREIVEIDEELCDGCGLCIPSCAEGAIQIVGGKAKLVSDSYCDGLGACLGHCPQDALKIIDREADAFDEVAVHEYLTNLKQMKVGCPSVANLDLGESKIQNHKNKSALSHWPVQLNLVPPKGSLYENADLLVVADCVPVAHPNFHSSLLYGRTVVMGCPKLDDIQGYGQKLSSILSENDIRSVTVAIMEVPCCSSLSRVVDWAVEKSGKQIPVRKHIISVKGERS
jgi:NAD-dependent dihydropyrimidine dehydrogenase PreA subunit